MTHLPLILLATISLVASCNPTSKESAVNPDRDRIAISAAVESIARNADLRQWDAVQTAFSPEVELDYGSPERVRSTEIIARWKSLLSAFDTTQHVLRDLRVSLDGDRATATAVFQATHALDGDVWTLAGRYEWSAARDSAGWKITRMKMIPGASTGNPALLDRAKEKASLRAAAEAASRTDGSNAGSPPVFEDVTFESQGKRLVGRLYLPEGKDRLPPVVIVTGSWLTVKEQMPARYAPLLVDAGFAVLTFDFRGFGGSDGQLREVESPARKADDIRAAVHFLQKQPNVDGSRIGVLPICASAGYAAVASTTEPAIKSITMVAPWLHDKAIVESIYGGAAGVADRMEKARMSHARFDETKTIDYVKAASNSDPSAAMYWEGDALDYYLNPKRGAIPEWGGRFAVMAWTEWLTFDPIAIAAKVAAPTRLVTGEQTATPGGARQFADAMKAAHDVVSLPGTQFDFYDNPTTVAAAAAAAVEHFRRTL
jgi:uncharacterized protein